MQHAEATPIRLNKYLSEAGFCSRREADRLLASGRVSVDGRTAEIGEKVCRGQQIEVDGKPVVEEEKEILLLFHKPRGIVVTSEVRKGVTNVEQFLKYPKRVFPIGRLDKESEGLLLMTNNGDLVNRILRAGNAHEKEYEVKVNREITPAFLKKMASGVEILDTVTLPAKVWQTGKYTFRIILIQGLNRQIRRMCEALGYKVVKLKRMRIMNFRLDRIPIGAYREATTEEYMELQSLLSSSTNLPMSETNHR